MPDADWLHVDVMDNHFVPNLTIGLPVVQALRQATDLPLDCHLMIDDPDRWAPPYAEAGARNVTVHAEAAADPVMLARDLRAAGALAGLAIKPGTPLEPYLDLLRGYDTLLVMTVEPGFGGQEFIAERAAQGPGGAPPGRVRPPRAGDRGRRRDQRGHHRGGGRGRCGRLRRRLGRLLTPPTRTGSSRRLRERAAEGPGLECSPASSRSSARSSPREPGEVDPADRSVARWSPATPATATRSRSTASA